METDTPRPEAAADCCIQSWAIGTNFLNNSSILNDDDADD